MPDATFQSLVDQHYASLYRFALSLARQSADACDLVQQTFYIWAEKGGSLREPAQAKTWLFTTLYREFLRGRRRAERIELMDTTVEHDPKLIAEATDCVSKADGQTVLAALGALDEAYRAPLSLFYLEDLSYLEIATTLGLPAGTVMSRLSRGKALLRAQLRQEGPGQIIPFPGRTSPSPS